MQLVPRIILGLWHSQQAEAAMVHLPYLSRWLISSSAMQAMRHWHFVDGISVRYTALRTLPYLSMLLKRAKIAQKEVVVWDVKSVREMHQCAAWGVNGVMTDFMQTYDVVRTSQPQQVLTPLPAEESETWSQTWQYLSNQFVTEVYGRLKLWRHAGLMRPVKA